MPEPETPHFDEGPKSPEVPRVPIAGQLKKDEKDDGEKTANVTVKNVAAIVGILATVAGILFGVQQILQSSRTFEEQRDQERRTFENQQKKQDNDFKLALDAQQNLAAKDREAFQQHQEIQNTAQQKSDEEIAKAEAQSAAAKRDEADAQAQKSENELQKAKLEADRADDLAKRTSDADKKKEVAQGFATLEGVVFKLRMTPNSDNALEPLGTIAGFLTSDEESIRRLALDSLEARLNTFPSRPEIDFIFASLPDAGERAIDVAARIDRRAWRILSDSIRAEYVKESKGRIRPMDRLPNPDVEDNVHRLLYPLFRGRSDSKFAWALRDEATQVILRISDGQKPPFLDKFPPLEIVVEMLSGSETTIERAISDAGRDSIIDLDGCFLPGFAPERNTRAESIWLRDSYIVGTDLNNLVGSIHLRHSSAKDERFAAYSGTQALELFDKNGRKDSEILRVPQAVDILWEKLEETKVTDSH